MPERFDGGVKFRIHQIAKCCFFLPQSLERFCSKKLFLDSLFLYLNNIGNIQIMYVNVINTFTLQISTLPTIQHLVGFAILSNCTYYIADPFLHFSWSVVYIKMSQIPRPINIFKADPNNQTATFSDCYIPTNEKSSLLRKYSAPNIAAASDPSHLQQLLPRSPSIGGSGRLPSLAAAAAASGQYHASPLQETTFLDAKLKCGLCKNAFIDPRVLDCLHTFCFQCILDMDEDELLLTGEDLGRRDNSVDLSSILICVDIS